MLELWPPFSFVGKLSFIIRRFFLRLEIILQVLNERRLPLDESFENFHQLSKVAAFHSNFFVSVKNVENWTALRGVISLDKVYGWITNW